MNVECHYCTKIDAKEGHDLNFRVVRKIIQVSYNNTTIIMYPLNVIIIMQEFGLCSYLYIFIGIIDLLYIFTRTTTFLTVFIQEKEKENYTTYELGPQCN